MTRLGGFPVGQEQPKRGIVTMAHRAGVEEGLGPGPPRRTAAHRAAGGAIEGQAIIEQPEIGRLGEHGETAAAMLLEARGPLVHGEGADRGDGVAKHVQVDRVDLRPERSPAG